MTFGHFVDGAVKGYQFVDEEQREAVRDSQRAQAIESDKSYRNEMLEQSKTRTAIAQANEGRASEAYERDKKASSDLALIQRDARAGFDFFKHGKPYPDDLYAEMKKNNLLDRSVFSSIVDERGFQASLKSGAILERLKAGDVNAINSPESMDILNDIYASQITKGVGEFNGPMGGSVVSKRIIDIDSSPKTGAITAEVQVNLDNGKSYTAPITLNRSTSSDDKVRLIDAGTAMDDLFGRYQRSKVSEQFQDQIKEEWIRLTNGGTDAGKQSAIGKTISDLEAHGLPKAEAIKIATQSKHNPQKAATSLAGVIAKTEWGQMHSPEEIFEEAKRILSDGTSPRPDSADPEVEAVLQANPGWDKAKAESYLQYLGRR